MGDNSKLKLPAWVERAKSCPIAFAQVREDAEIDLKIARQYPAPQILMVASGGCTVAALVASESASQIFAVDVNPSQIALSKVKIALLKNDTSSRLELLGHKKIDPITRLNNTYRLCDNLNIDPSIFGDNQSLSTIGLDHMGRYELLFSELRNDLKSYAQICSELCIMDSVSAQTKFLSTNRTFQSALKDAFDRVMNLDILVELFGSDATNNRLRSFSEHFFQRMEFVFTNLPSRTNPYLAQVLLGCFASDTYLPWIQMGEPSKLPSIEFLCGSMEEILSEQENETFDIIHLSNILDWITPTKAAEVLGNTYRCLRKDGAVIIRQLNSNLNIPTIDTELNWDHEQAGKLHQVDRSFFYSALHVGYKR
jgi:S-adenosylmethionine-diacylglycerol 3-amino-3-carboxypropyl transferase